MDKLKSLLEALYWFTQPENWMTILVVGLGLGFVIFIHELGHFAVAKWCGVRCSKFYVGFDAPLGRFFDWLIELVCMPFRKSKEKLNFFERFIPTKLAKYTSGDTEYGIGIIPLGGYVKMLGQDDDPSQAAEEMLLIEKQRKAEAMGKPLPESERVSEERIKELLDPSSYITKTVPQRLAIITAGVIMNVISAVFMAIWAFKIGVKKAEPEIDLPIAGGPAWQAGITPGDRVTKIGNEEIQYYDEIRNHVTWKEHDREAGIPFQIERPGVKEPLQIMLRPDTKDLAPMVKITANHTLTFGGATSESVAGKLMKETKDDKLKLQPGDVITHIDGQPLKDYQELTTQLLLKRAQPIELTAERTTIKEDKSEEKITVKMQLPPQPYKELGFQMTLGPVNAVRAGSIAEQAGLKYNDQLLRINGTQITTPAAVRQQLRALVGKQIELVVQRKVSDKNEEVTLLLTPVAAPWNEEEFTTEWVLSGLGATCAIEPIVREIDPAGPAAKTDLKVGTVLKRFRILAPKEPPPKKLFALDGREDSLKFLNTKTDREYCVWLSMFDNIQTAWGAYQVKFTDSDAKEYVIGIVDSKDEFVVSRHLFFETKQKQCPTDWVASVTQGLGSTWEGLTMVVGTFKRLITGEISVKALGGPVTIANAAGSAASGGFSSLLLFLVMLSANLAVVNMLPIPVLDGGHVVFLIYEWIFGSPMPARIYSVLVMIGFVMLMSLMLFVLGLDFGFLERYSSK
jgi:regulator of sigma E protease